MRKIMFFLSVIAFFLAVVALLVTVVLSSCFADSNAEGLADAIFLAEGGYKATYLYGIRSVKYDTEAEARQICLNTIRNNEKRYADYGYKKYDTYLEFLASRYCPINADNDPRGLNQNWLKNVKYYYKGAK